MNNSLSLSHLILALITATIWGFVFVFGKIAVEHFEPFTTLTLRLLTVTLILLPLYPKPPAPIKNILIIALTFAVLHLGSMLFSLYLGLDASLGVVTEQIAIPAVLILGVILLKEKIGMRAISGVVIAILGTFFLMNTPNSINNPLAFCLMLMSGIFWAFYSIALKKTECNSPIALIAWISFFGFLMNLPLMLIFEGNPIDKIPSATLSVWSSLAYTAVGSSIIAHGLWCYLLKYNQVSTISPFVLLVPLVGVLGGIILLDEPITQNIIIGTILMVIGVGIIILRRPAISKEMDL